MAILTSDEVGDSGVYNNSDIHNLIYSTNTIFSKVSFSFYTTSTVPLLNDGQTSHMSLFIELFYTHVNCHTEIQHSQCYTVGLVTILETGYRLTKK